MVKIKSTPKRRRVGVNLMRLFHAKPRPMKPWVAYVKKYMPYVKIKHNFKPSKNASRISRKMSLTQRNRGLYSIMANYRHIRPRKRK